MKNGAINVKGSEIAVYRRNRRITSPSDIARCRDAERIDFIIQNWLRNLTASF